MVQMYGVQNLDVGVINRKLLIYFSLFQACKKNYEDEVWGPMNLTAKALEDWTEGGRAP